MWPDNRRYQGRRAEAAIAAYVGLARESGLDPAQMALSYVLGRPFLTAAIIGATTMDQLRNAIGAANIPLPQDVLDGIEKIHGDYTYPCP